MKRRAVWHRFLKACGFVESDGFIPQNPRLDGGLPRTRYPYRRDIGQGLDSNVVMAPVFWIMRNFVEAEPIVQRRTDSRWQRAEDHPLELLLHRPNPFYDGVLLMQATLLSYCTDGNAYWLKMRNAFGEVVALWYLPHFLVEPRWPFDGSEFISHYDYRPDFGPPMQLPVRDVVHHRFGLDPRNVRLGMSPLKPLLREVFTDEEASNFSATILRNMGVPGGVISPKDASALPKSDDVEQMRKYMKKDFTGDKRGEWLVVGVPTHTEQFGFDPNNLMLGNLRDIAEERVCATFGIPAAVVGFGAGLQQTKVGATMRELRRSAWVNCLIPMQNALAKQETAQLMPDFAAQLRRFRVRYDQSEVSVFQEDESEFAKREALLVEKGIQRVDRAQEALGLEVDPTQNVYLRPTNVTAVAEGDSGIAQDPGPSPPPANGNGAAPTDDVAETMNRVRLVLSKFNGV